MFNNSKVLLEVSLGLWTLFLR